MFLATKQPMEDGAGGLPLEFAKLKAYNVNKLVHGHPKTTNCKVILAKG